MKFMMYGDAENEPKEPEMMKLVEEIFNHNLLIELISHMRMFEFEVSECVIDTSVNKLLSQW